MIYDQHGKPFGISYTPSWRFLNTFSSNLLEKFGQSKATMFGPLLYDQFGKPIPRTDAPKTIKFRRYESLRVQIKEDV